MQKILNKRVFRSLKKHWFRYAALFFLIVMVMYMIVAMVASSEAIMRSTVANQEASHIEDGYFQTFVPLDDNTFEQLKNNGVTVEEQNYIDFGMADGSTVRVYKQREAINLISVASGNAVQSSGEAVVEQRYAEDKNLSVGDKITLGGMEFTVCGTGSTAEIESPKKNIADTSNDCSAFGIAFVTAKDYNSLLSSGKSENSEVYNYSFLLGDTLTYSELEDYLRSIELDRSVVADKYFLEMLDNAEQQKNNITDGINELVDGTSELSDGMNELSENNADLLDGANEIFTETLKSTENQLNASGFSLKLTAENFEEELTKAADMVATLNPAAVTQITAAKGSLIGLKKFCDGVTEYTNAVSKANDGTTELSDGVNELKTETDKLIDEYFTYDLDNLTAFMKSEDNTAIGAAADDVKTTLGIAIFAGIIMLVLITYVISIFVIHSIDRETSVIGALYALGVKRKQLITHYLMLPVIVTFLGGLIGTLIGFSSFAIEQQLETQYAYFSIPTVEYVYPLYLIIYGIVLPPVIAAIVNYIVIRKKLSVPALKMLRNEQKQSKASNIKVKGGSFIHIFRIRQTLREMRSCAAVVVGMFISLLVLMLGMDCYYGCKNIAVQNKRDITYNYMYLYKYTVDEPPENSEAVYCESLKKRFGEFNYDITFCGIDDDNKYFDFNVNEGENLVALSSSAATKYGLFEGDKLVVTDEISGRDYAFTVDKIVEYSIGMYAFMDIGSMRELFGQEDNYFNAVFSDSELDIDAGRLYAVTSRESIEKASDVFVTLMKNTFVMLIVISIIVFVIVMYLMIKVMIDRSAQNIALMKVFGYRKKEVRKLYLDGNFMIIVISALVCIPLAKNIIDAMFPSFVENVPMGMDLSMPPLIYAVIYGGIIFCYLIISLLLTKKLKKIVPAEILKNRE